MSRRVMPTLFRFSTLVRLLWIAVAALHVWLIARRLETGVWLAPAALAKLALCAAAVAYCSLKVWRVATVFDSAPRRVIAFTLLLVLGHWAIATPQTRQAALEHAPLIALSTLAILPARPAAARRLLRAAARRCRALFDAVPSLLLPSPGAAPRAPRHWLSLLAWAPPSLFRRPPPSLA